MPSALLPDLIAPRRLPLRRRSARRGRRRVRGHPAADQLREPSLWAARDEDGGDGGCGDRLRRGPASDGAAASGDAGRPPRADARGQPPRPALGKIAHSPTLPCTLGDPFTASRRLRVAFFSPAARPASRSHGRYMGAVPPAPWMCNGRLPGRPNLPGPRPPVPTMLLGVCGRKTLPSTPRVIYNPHSL